jgi:hypothetical protein
LNDLDLATWPVGAARGLPLLANAGGQSARSGSGHHECWRPQGQQRAVQATRLLCALNRIVGPVVDADGISKSIMTVKYSRKATPEQMQTLPGKLQESLFQFYGNALLEYNNQGITVDPAKDESATAPASA